MPVFDTYSKRKRRAEQGEPDVYQYDQVPERLRIQVRHILDTALGIHVGDIYGERRNNNALLIELHRIILRETGQLSLPGGKNPKQDILSAVIHALPDIDEWLTVVELCFLMIHMTIRRWDKGSREDRGITQDPDDAIEELNARFREAGLGYQFEAGQIVRVDSQYIHSEVVKPALKLLVDRRFAGAQQEFLSAHAHYRAGEHEDAILDANRAFESTMKTICDIRSWDYQKARGAGDLIGIICDNGLLPRYLIATLQSGLPRVRNEAGGHGQGPTPRQTPGHIAGYALHVAAANVVLLIGALKETIGSGGG